MDLAGVILTVINWLLSLYAAITYLFHQLAALRDTLVAWLYCFLEWFLPRKRFHLPKLPSHLAILFTDEKSSNDTLIMDICWYCVIYGIPELSLYDPWSILRNDKERLVKLITNRMTSCDELKLAVNLIVNDQIWANKHSLPANDHMTLRLNFLGKESGRQSMVRVARQLAFEGVEPDDVTTNKIGETLAKFSIGEPDLLIKMGPLNSFCGYPPWALRLTEVIQLNSHSNGLTELEFVECLQTFSKRKQRCGK